MKSISPFIQESFLLDAHKIIRRELDSNLFNRFDYGTYSAEEYLYAFGDRIASQLAVELQLLATQEHSTASVLCIGGWPGMTAVCLKHAGWNVTALEHPSLAKGQLAELYNSAHIPLIPLDAANFSSSGIFQDGTFTFIECCQCIEHWPFNPIPTVSKLIQLLSATGTLLLTVPNAASLYRRVSALMGKNPYPSLSDFILQMNPDSHADVSPHWREYTRQDAMELVETCGGKVLCSWREFHTRKDHPGIMRILYDLIQRTCPALRDHIGLLCTK